MRPPPAPLTRDRVLHLINRMQTSRVVVVGDIMLDRYLVGDTERLSPEAPVPVVTVRERHAALGGADALLLEDYNKGALPPALIAAGMEVARRRGIPVVVDPKYRQCFEYAGATGFKPNRRELESALGAAVDLQTGNALSGVLSRLQVDNLLVTLGAEGMVLVMKDGSTTHIPSIAREIYDVSGAGDTVTAWMGTALAAGASVREAAQLANYAAGVEVSKAGVATVSPQEVLAAHEERFDQIGRLRRGGLI